MAVQKLMFDIIGNADKVDKAFDDVVKSAETMGGKLKSAGKKAFTGMMDPRAGAAAGAVSGAALAKGFQYAIEKGSVSRDLTANLGLDAGQAEAAASATGGLYSDAFGESLQEVGDAVETVMSSFPGMRDAGSSALEDITGKALALSKSLGTDVTETAAAAGVMVSTGLAKDSAEAFDLMAAASQKVPKAMRGELLPVMEEYAKDFQALGIDGPNAMGLIADAAQGGKIQMDKTGDALKEFMIRASDLDDKGAQTALEQLGLSGKQTAKDLLGGGDAAKQASQEIISGLQGIKDPGAQASAAIALFGTPLEDIGKNEIPGFLNALTSADGGMGETAGKAEELSNAVSEGPGAQLKQLGRTVEETFGGIVSGALPILEPLLEGLKQFAPILGPLVLAMGAFAIVQGIVNAVMWASPITWIIAGILLLIAAIALLVANWDTIVAWGTEVWGGFINWLTELITGFAAGWNAMWGAIGAFLVGLWQGFVTGAQEMGANLVAFFVGLPDMILGVLKGAGDWLFNAGKNIVQGLIDGIQSLAGTIGNFFLDLLPGWIVGPFKAALGIHSPSRVFAGFGENIGEGVLLGVEDVAPAIDNQMANLVNVPDEGGPVNFAAATAPMPASQPTGSKSVTFAPVYQVQGGDSEELFQKLWPKFRNEARKEGLILGA